MKIVDPITGNTSIVRDTFVNEYTTDSSVRFDRLCNLLGLDKYARMNKDLSSKVSFLYNKMAKIVGDDPYKIADAVEVFKKNTRSNNLSGRDMIDSLYRILRLESDREESLQRLKIKLDEEQKRSEDFHNSFIEDTEHPSMLQTEISSKGRLDDINKTRITDN